jgi:hypothetical protein
VDLYWQKSRGIKVWQRYAASTLPPSRRTALPAKVTDLSTFEEFIYGEELPNEWGKRKLPCEFKEWEQNAPKAPLLPTGGNVTGLETTVTESCDIVYQGEKLVGVVEKWWRDAQVCKGIADAEFEHEKVHQQICRDTWAANRFLAPKRLITLRNVAQSELKAWKRHRNMLRDQIRKLAKDCGWQETDAQKGNPNAVPDEQQTKEMENQGWSAYNLLTGTHP